MKLLCTKKNLYAGLQISSRVISSGNTLPILNNILLKTDQGRLKLSSTNLEIAIKTWVVGKIEEEGELTIPARLINDYVSNLPADKITITTQGTNLILEGEHTQTHIKGLPADEFPLIPEIGEKIYTKIDGKELTRAIGEVAFAPAFTETQPEISGVLLHFEGGTLTLAATDRYRLAESTLALEEAVGEAKQVIIPARAVNEIGRLAGAGKVEIYLKEGQICFKTADTEVISRLIEGQYPDYKQIIPNNFVTESEVKRNEFIQALKATSLFAAENNNIELEINPSGKTVVIKSQSVQTGDSEIRLEGEVSGEKNSIIFNFRYLLDCLNSIPDERVVLKMINASSPAAVVPVGRDNYLYIVMPIKI